MESGLTLTLTHTHTHTPRGKRRELVSGFTHTNRQTGKNANRGALAK